MVFKFLNKGKKSEFFLEAPPSNNGAEPAAPAPKATPAAPAPEPAPVKVATVTPEAAPAKTKKIKKSKSEVTQETAPAAAPAPKPAVIQPPSNPNFATDFLMPSTMPRRRPGPNMEMFRNMAREVAPKK